jgi:ribonuclease Y
MFTQEVIIALTLGALLGFGVALIIYLIRRGTTFRMIAHSQEIAEEIKRNAKTEAETAKKAAILEGRDEWFKQKRGMEDEIRERQKELRIQEKKYNERLGSLDKRLDSLDKKESNLSDQERKLKQKEEELLKRNSDVDRLIAEQRDRLAEIAGLSRDEAVARMREELISQARQVAANDAKLTIDQIKLDTSKKWLKFWLPRSREWPSITSPRPLSLWFHCLQMR